MKYIIRAKAVSECLGIRRAYITYFKKEDIALDVSTLEHPLKDFKKITLIGNTIEVLDEAKELILGEEIYFYKNNKVLANNKETIERMTLGLLLMPLDKEMVDYYQKAIADGYLFDQWNGEFEYILGMMYELEENDLIEADNWYTKAKNKKFPFCLKKGE